MGLHVDSQYCALFGTLRVPDLDYEVMKPEESS